MNEIEKLEKKHKFKCIDFKKSIDNYYSSVNSFLKNPNFNSEESEKVFENLTKNFLNILEISRIENRIKKPYRIYGEEYALIKSPKAGMLIENTSFEVTIGLFREFYVVSEIKFCNNIKFMKDEFWTLLFELSTIGSFEFKEDKTDLYKPSQKHKHLFNKRGNYYKLMRNYFLTQAEYGQTRGLGYIAVKWDNKIEPKLLIPKCIKAVGIMHKLNKLLWRSEIKNTTSNTLKKK